MMDLPTSAVTGTCPESVCKLEVIDLQYDSNHRNYYLFRELTDPYHALKYPHRKQRLKRIDGETRFKK